MSQDLIPEPQLAAAIADATGAPCPFSYVALSNRRRSGAWPAVQIGTRWHVRRADLPMVLAALGLTAKFEMSISSQKAKSPARRSRRVAV